MLRGASASVYLTSIGQALYERRQLVTVTLPTFTRWGDVYHSAVSRAGAQRLESRVTMSQPETAVSLALSAIRCVIVCQTKISAYKWVA